MIVHNQSNQRITLCCFFITILCIISIKFVVGFVGATTCARSGTAMDSMSKISSSVHSDGPPSFDETFIKDHPQESILSRISYRPPTPQDIPRCWEIEAASYPPDEAATLERLYYRQAHATNYFQCAILDNEQIIGFVCSTRCLEFREESMATHIPTGPYLAIHSVVVHPDYRRQGIASAMLQTYLQNMQNNNVDDESIQSVVLLSKAHLLGFYVNCGFQVNRPSPIIHGQELWYELEKPLTSIKSLPGEDESWFCKTEQFKRPYLEIKPYLEKHKQWVQTLRRQGVCITSGYRVDSQGKPGGGGLMFLAAKNYDEALKLVQQDPLVANDCVDWELNGWIGQVGDIQMR